MTLLSQKQNVNAIEVTRQLFKLLDINVTQTSLKSEFGQHPDYPSMLSISDVIRSYNIENIAIKTKIERLRELPMPCIVTINDTQKKEKFTIIKSIKGDLVCYFNPKTLKYQDISISDFSEVWKSGIAMLLDSEEARGEFDYLEKRKREKRQQFYQFISYATVPFLILMNIGITLNSGGLAAVIPSLFTFLGLAGGVISGLLIWFEIDEFNPILQQICKATEKVNCSAVLSSKAAKIIGINWSYIGFVYFLGTTSYLSLEGLSNKNTLFIVSWLGIVASLYSCFSVYYQWKIVKNWCALCLAVQCILVLQAGIIWMQEWAFNPLPVSLTFSTFLPIIIAFIIPSVMLALIMPVIRSSKLSEQREIELQRFKHNPQIFNTLLERQKLVAGSLQGLGIVLGDPQAKHRVIKVCNPYCEPCARAHSPLGELLDNNPDVQLQIIFTASEDDSDYRAAPVKHLLAVQEKYGKKAVKEALDEWYEAPVKDFETFSSKYNLEIEAALQQDRLKAMRNWCNDNAITFTPTFFINGHKLPEMYSVADLKYFLIV